MKKSKILAPVLTIAGLTAVAAPMITLASCNKASKIKVECVDKTGKIQFTAPSELEEGKDCVITVITPIHYLIDIESSSVEVNEKYLKYDETTQEFKIDWNAHTLTIPADIIKAKGGKSIKVVLNSFESTHEKINISHSGIKIKTISVQSFDVYAAWAEKITVDFTTYSEYVSEKSIKIEGKNCTIDNIKFDAANTKGSFDISWTAEQSYNHFYGEATDKISVSIKDIELKTTLTFKSTKQGIEIDPTATIDIVQGGELAERKINLTLSGAPAEWTEISAAPNNPELQKYITLACAKEDSKWVLKVTISKDNSWLWGAIGWTDNTGKYDLAIDFAGK